MKDSPAQLDRPSSDFQHLYAIIVNMYSEIGMKSLVHLQSLQQGHSYSMVGLPVSSGAPTHCPA